MGRRKVEIKRIQDKNCRQVAFCKRRKGLLKKAKEISVLCDVDVAVVIISNRGRLHEFSSNNSLTEILQRYESHVEAEKENSAEIQVPEHSKYSGFTTMGELLQTTERQLEETNDDGLAVTDLIHLENELQTALIQVRSRKTHLLLESAKGLHEKVRFHFHLHIPLHLQGSIDSLNFNSQIKEKLLQEEKKHLEDNIASIKKNREVNEMSTDFADFPAPHIICGQQRMTLNFLYESNRRKLEIKRIESKSCRQVAFCKRRNGLIKKAKDLSTLCDVDVAVVIISNRGSLHEFVII
ncbi:hypothetical protein MTR67_050552 [Solanum verrucosum]|uniref:Uncharacterized protein n=1 Tax=Solanum verrucosum TaxID=315347 RepID=A0AAF0ZYE3_SOLVR|nr:hypothetical protein MTR67_050552 [Solanum verrucosum]